LAFGAVSDPLLAAALWTGLGAFALSVLLVFVILAMRLLLLVRLAHERRVAALWQPLFAQCMFEVPAARPALPARDAEVFLRLWCGAEESLLGAARKNLVEFAQRLGAASHVERLLRDGRPAVRLLALVAAGHLGLREQLPTLERLVRQGSAVTSLTAAHAMLRIEPAHGLPRLIAVAARREDWPIAHVANMLGEADPAAVGPLLAAAVRSELRRPRSGPGVAPGTWREPTRASRSWPRSSLRKSSLGMARPSRRTLRPPSPGSPAPYEEEAFWLTRACSRSRGRRLPTLGSPADGSIEMAFAPRPLSADELPDGPQAEFDSSGRLRAYTFRLPGWTGPIGLEVDPVLETGSVRYEKQGEEYRDGAAVVSGPFTDPRPVSEPFWAWVRRHVAGVAEAYQHYQLK
jgi:hypothetical protein